jgi:hypothetical protein
MRPNHHDLPGRLVSVCILAVVSDDDADSVRRTPHRHPSVGRLSMFQNIVDSFLDDTVDMDRVALVTISSTDQLPWLSGWGLQDHA